MQDQLARFALVERGRLAVGESVLVRGADSALGLAVVRTARAAGAARVLGVAAVSHAGAVLAAGATEHLAPEGFRDQVRAAGRVELVVDLVGGEGFVDALRCLAVEGRAVVVPDALGAPAEFRVNRLLLNNIEVVTAAWSPAPTGRGGVAGAR